ncbi:dynein regulatory complex protein 1 [Salvelinus alpinus]|uniref:dynein regulatory complex protein 1 n=1 Tax=Salvelinus sp. IW2-2015 TaxID=2691554 RepID=UPI000CDF5BCC|nr:dynein regulatory complex protein 1 [Salvelinus alpinus]
MSQTGNLRDDTEEAGPSVDSENPEERIAARRLRIAARSEANKRQELGDDSHEKKEIKEEARKSQHQVEQSEKRMIKLQSDGTELVTNIQVAADSRESQRQTEVEEAHRLRVEKLENEAKSSLEKFEEITRKWTVAKMKEIPQDLRDSLSSQQQLCALLIEDKNKLIHELQQEMKLSDDRYVKNLKKQAEDVDLMIERMEDQVKFLMGSYRDELDQIENSFEHERKILLTGNRTKWEQYMKERRDKELENVMQRMKRVDEYEVLLQQLRTEDAEEYNMIKIKLDTDVQILEQQLQQMKATYQLNQEKLEYNFQVLKKRDEENTITKSQQKRKITRLQDVVNNLKIKCANQEKQSREENQNLTDDYTRIMQQYKHMQKKMRHFAAIDAKKFEEVWLMNEEEVKALVEKALDTDRLVHEQQLGLAWQRPSLAFMERCGPLQPQRQAQKTAHQAISELLQLGQTSGCSPGKGKYQEAGVGPGAESPGLAVEVYDSGAGLESGSSEVEREREGSEGEHSGRLSAKMVKKLLELLCDEAGFLIESKLLKLLSPLEKDEQSLMKLDSIFTAMGIESEEDVYKLADFFMKYRHTQGEQTQDASAKWGVASPQAERGEFTSSCSPPSDLIHPNDVLVALRAFTAHHCRPRELATSHQPSMLGLGGRDDTEDAAYWEAMGDVIPEAKLKIWGALETALYKYHIVLTERSKFITDTQSLKQQNTELRMLLHQYVNSRVNAELEIPPNLVMQLAPE